MEKQNNNLLENQDNELSEVQQSKRAARWRRLRVLYLEPAVALYAIGDFMNYTILQQYVYYRVAEDLSLPVDYMMEESGGCGTIESNSTNTSVIDKYGEVEAKVTLLIDKLNINDVFSLKISLQYVGIPDKANGKQSDI